ncbi:hypothetical protein [Yersinia enterocolitica]|uniref:hypothetical protein n=1 Tax=Yersinia enterocolitica TaxID=630 RepID=UPI0009770D05|nr:hypothetical protein [Yersinia enterocolitica]HEI6829842.1 hypothetical protein [Yersinia enterocolitica]
MGKYCHSLAELESFKKMTNAEKIAQSVELTTSKNGQYEFFIDTPQHQPGPRLNIVGHGDKGGQTFQGDIPGATLLSPSQLGILLQPQIRETGAKSIRLVSCRSSSTGFAQALANQLDLPVKAPVGSVTMFEVMKNRFWILKRTYINPHRPEDHLWHWHFPNRQD